MGENGVYKKKQLKGYYDHYNACKDLDKLKADKDQKEMMRMIKKGDTQAIVLLVKEKPEGKGARTLGQLTQK